MQRFYTTTRCPIAQIQGENVPVVRVAVHHCSFDRSENHARGRFSLDLQVTDYEQCRLLGETRPSLRRDQRYEAPSRSRLSSGSIAQFIEPPLECGRRRRCVQTVGAFHASIRTAWAGVPVKRRGS